MKNRVNQILLAAFLISAVLYVLCLLNWLEIIPRPFYDPDDPFRFSGLWAYLGLGFQVVPCFCLQLLVCRTARRPVMRLIPLFLLVGIMVLVGMAFSTSTGFDALGWGILLCLCIAPGVGYALAWGMYGIWRAFRKGHKESVAER